MHHPIQSLYVHNFKSITYVCMYVCTVCVYMYGMEELISANMCTFSAATVAVASAAWKAACRAQAAASSRPAGLEDCVGLHLGTWHWNWNWRAPLQQAKMSLGETTITMMTMTMEAAEGESGAAVL